MPKLRPLIRWTPSLYNALAKHYDRLARLLFPIGDLGREVVVSGLDSGGFWIRLFEKVGILCVEYPHNYRAQLSAMGYEVEAKELGWNGMYPFIRAWR